MKRYAEEAFMHARKAMAVMALICVVWTESAAATVTSARSGSWTAGSTWVGGRIPSASDAVTIASGHTVSFAGIGSVGGTGTLTIQGNIENFDGSVDFGGRNVVITGSASAQTIAGFTTTGLISVTKSSGIARLKGNVKGASFTMNATGGRLHLGDGLVHTLTGTIICFRGTIDCGSSTLNIGAFAGGIGGTWIPGTGTVNFASNSLQIIPPIPYYDLAFSGTGVKAVFPGTTLTIGRTLTINSPAIFSGSAGASIGGNLTGTGAITMGSGTIALGGSWTNTGAFTKGKSTVLYNGAGAQTAGPLAYYHLSINKPSGLAVLGGSATVTGTLTLANGLLSVKDKDTLVLGESSVIAGASGATYIVGTLTRPFTPGTPSFVFPIGDQSGYAPIGVTFGKVTRSGTLTAKTTKGNHPAQSASGIDPSRHVDRYWTLRNNGIGFDTCSAVFNFSSGDVTGDASAAAFVVRRFTSSSWDTCTTGVRTPTSTQVSGIAPFGDFTLGAPMSIDPPSVTVNVKAFLTGPFGSGAMATQLRAQGRIPLSSASAYRGDAYRYTPETVTAIPEDVVDWVIVELRRGIADSTRMASRAAFLLATGQIVDINGTSPVNFNGVTPGSYYIVIRHRNHLPVMSAGPVALTASSMLYDFTTGLSKAYGTNPMMDLPGGSFGLWAGDGNRNGNVRYSGVRNDRSLLLTTVGLEDLTVARPGYLDADFNLDGAAKYSGSGNDNSFLLRTVGVEDLTNVIVSQVPDQTLLGMLAMGKIEQRIPYAQDEEAIVAVPKRFSLSQNYPNPFNPSTTVQFSIAERCAVSLKIYDITGREIVTVMEGAREPGYYTVTIDGSSLSSGVYLYRLTAAGGTAAYTDVKRFVLMK